MNVEETTALETLHKMLVDLYPHLTNDRDYVNLNTNGTLDLYTKKITLLQNRLHPLTIDEHACLLPYLHSAKLKKPELNTVIRLLSIDLMLADLNQSSTNITDSLAGDLDLLKGVEEKPRPQSVH